MQSHLCILLVCNKDFGTCLFKLYCTGMKLFAQLSPLNNYFYFSWFLSVVQESTAQILSAAMIPGSTVGYSCPLCRKGECFLYLNMWFFLFKHWFRFFYIWYFLLIANELLVLFKCTLTQRAICSRYLHWIMQGETAELLWVLAQLHKHHCLLLMKFFSLAFSF